MSIIYGVDTSKPYSPRDVRDALVECFTEAHKEQLEALREFVSEETTDQEFENIKRIDIRQTIGSVMKSVGEDFDKPTKTGLIKAVEGLKEYAKNFRDQSIVEKHYSEMSKLLSGLK